MFNIFISFRFINTPIAEVIRRQLSAWGFPDDNIFMAGDPKFGVLPGDRFNKVIVDRLRDTDLFLLVFTTHEVDFLYCMWEYGNVTGADSKPTRIVVFDCNDQQLKIGNDILQINVSNDAALRDFVRRMHKRPDFYAPDEASARTIEHLSRTLSSMNNDEIETRAEKFSEAVRAVVRDTVEFPDAPATHRLAHLRVTLDKLSASEVRDLRQKAVASFQGGDRAEHDRLREQAKDILKKRLLVHPDSNPRALDELGYDSLAEPRLFNELVNHWWSEIDGGTHPDASLSWWNNLLEDFSRSTEGSKSKPKPHYLVSPRHGNPKVQPVIATSRRNGNSSMEFVVYLFRLPEPEPPAGVAATA